MYQNENYFYYIVMGHFLYAIKELANPINITAARKIIMLFSKKNCFDARKESQQ